MKKTIIALVLSLIMIFSIALSASASSMVLGVNPAQATPDSTVTLNVTVTPDTGISALLIHFSYDSSLEFVSASWLQSVTSNNPSMIETGVVTANGASSTVQFNENKNISGTVLTATFKVKASAQLGTTLVNVSAFAESNLSGTTVNKFNATTSSVITVICSGNHNITAYDGDCTKAVICDECSQTILPATTHVDNNGDYKCDNAGCLYEFDRPTCPHPKTATRTMVVSPATCKDSGSAFTMVYCTVCGQTISTFPMTLPATNAHIDENDDHKCDTCETVMSECEDADKDGKCDVCGKSLVTEHVHELEHVEAKAATCTENGNIEYWYCEGCDSYFTDAEGKNKVDAADVVVPAAHKVEHVAAKEATETEDGNIEYWHCPECGGIWLDADCTTAAKLEDVVIPATGHVHELVHTEAKEATCFEEGNLEYWYCAGCDCYFTDAEGKYNIAYLSLILPVAHKVEHVEAKAATCFEEGNIEYWYCTECGYAWLDELCTKNTNLLAVILPVSHKIVHVEAKAPTATEEGNIEYWYCTECGYAWLDELCTKNTNLKAVILPATGEEINPPTGDATILYIAAVAVIATLGVAVIRFKKREEN